MSKENRTIEQVQSEYNALCARAGYLQYQLFIVKKDLDLINSTLRDLNMEAASIKEAKKVEETLPAESSPNQGDVLVGDFTAKE